MIKMDFELKHEFKKEHLASRGYPCLKVGEKEIMRQVVECLEAGLCKTYEGEDYPKYSISW